MDECARRRIQHDLVPARVRVRSPRWHTNPYIGREFHQVWGDFDVTIHMPAAYMIGGPASSKTPKTAATATAMALRRLKE